MTRFGVRMKSPMDKTKPDSRMANRFFVGSLCIYSWVNKEMQVAINVTRERKEALVASITRITSIWEDETERRLKVSRAVSSVETKARAAEEDRHAVAMSRVIEDRAFRSLIIGGPAGRGGKSAL